MKSVRYLVVLSIIFAFLCVGTYLVAAPYAIVPFVSSILSIALPLVLLVVLYRTLKADWRIFTVGMLTFAATQILYLPFKDWTLLPLLDGLGINADPQSGVAQLVVFGVIVGLSAGVFSETARYIVYGRFMEKARAWKDGLTLGAGFGGAQTIVVGVFTLLNFLLAITVRNGGLDSLPPQEYEADLAFSTLYWSNAWYFFLLPLIKQISAIMLHMSASVLVLQVFTRRKMFWYFGAILLHPIFEATRVFAFTTWGEVSAEIVVILLAALTLGFIFKLRSADPDALLQPAEHSQD